MSNSTRPRYRVVTGIAPPFVMYNSTSRTFYGYCIDLLNDVQSLLGFDYDIRESFDRHFGYIDTATGTWNGMIHELMTNTSDIAIAPIWITMDRRQVVDFTIPFYKQNGFSIMMLKPKQTTPFLRFLMILELQVWLGFAFAFFLTTFLIYLFERYSPFSYRNMPEKYKDAPDDRFCSLKECFWFTATSLTPQGGGDVPKNLSGKLAAATWWLFGFVIVAAYMANLAAYETLMRLERYIESMDDLRRQYQVEYSVRRNSATFRYFYSMQQAERVFYTIWRKMSLNESMPDWERSQYTVWDYPLEEKYSTMYAVMSTVGLLPSVEEALRRLKKVNNTRDFALIDETITIRYLMLTNCGFRQVGDEFAKRPMAFALPYGSRLKSGFDDALNTLMIRRRLNELEEKWWKNNPERAQCPEDRDVNSGFGLDSLAAVFMLLIIGIFLSAVILCAQYFWYCHLPRRRARRNELFAKNKRNIDWLTRNDGKSCNTEKREGRLRRLLLCRVKSKNFD